jgi:hypothetical protein
MVLPAIDLMASFKLQIFSSQSVTDGFEMADFVQA